MKKIAVIGKGTVGGLTLAHFHRWTSLDLDWYYDPNTRAQAVGEGSTIKVSESLYSTIGFSYADLAHVDGTVKTGIMKKGWSTGNTFLHPFPPPSVGYHLNAVKLQEFLFERFKQEPRVKIIEGAVTPDQVDADFVISCAGAPQTMDQHIESTYIPVNTCYVTQCFWDAPRFNHTLTLARPYGWVFGIPLQNRCSIGYLYNKNINTLEEIKEDVKEIFEQYNLTPSDVTNHLQFRNYYRKENFTERVAYNGNASFFLEPLEATSLDFAESVARHTFDIWNNEKTVERANTDYLNEIQQIQSMIMLHYLNGSVYKTPFWDFAQDRAEQCLSAEFDRSRTLSDFVDHYKNFRGKTYINYRGPIDVAKFGTWAAHSFWFNLEGLEIYPKLDHIRSHR